VGNIDAIVAAALQHILQPVAHCPQGFSAQCKNGQFLLNGKLPFAWIAGEHQLQFARGMPCGVAGFVVGYGKVRGCRRLDLEGPRCWLIIIGQGIEQGDQ
jgi:hypothetical protein